MIGWEYPPQNSGGLGVACQGMTEALSEQNTHLYFTLPHQSSLPLSHMDVLDCSDPSWFEGGTSNKPPFFAYSSAISSPYKFEKGLLDRHKLQMLPQSEMEEKVDQYAEIVFDKGAALKNDYQVIHAHDWMSFPAAMRLAQATKKPFIAHVHSTELDRIPTGSGSPYIMSTEYQGMQQATRVIAVSFYTKHLLVHKYGIDPNKIDVVHNGISPLLSPPDVGRHHFAPKRPVIVFMGRLTMQKGADYFLALSQSVLRQLPSALFVVAGSGDMYHELLLQTAGRGLSANVLFSGFVRDSQREKLLDRADAFVMPSVSEPFGLVALEAAQRNTPVIVSSNSGVSEVMPSSHVVDFWDVDKMTEKIVEVITDEKGSEQIVKNQQLDLQSVTWQASAGKITDIYKKVFVPK